MPRTIDIEVLAEFLRKIKGAAPATITVKTFPRMVNKENPYYNLIYKLAKVNGMINCNYESMVNRQRIREGKDPDFEALKRSWGIRMTGTPLVLHKNKQYLEIKVQGSEYEYRYISSDKLVNKDSVNPFILTSSTARQQLDNPVILRDYSLENIKGIAVEGKFFEIK